jgi:DNA end-binding protein Ku
MRAIWTGAIGFGLVNIPVKMYSAVQESSLDLDMLDKHDHSNIRFARINETTGEEVAWGDIVKAFKYQNKYVVLEEEDFERAAPRKSQVVEIDEFTTPDQIDAMYYEAPYYLKPDKGGDRGYALLREALEATGKVAVGSYVMRGKQHVCVLRAVEDALVLLRIRFAEEIRDSAELDLPGKASVKPAEMKVAKALIEQMSTDKLSLKKYKDSYHAELMKVIRAKARGKAPAEPRFQLVRSKAKDLMAELKASLESGGGKRKKAS